MPRQPPRLLIKAARRSLPLGYWEAGPDDYQHILLDDHLATSENLIASFTSELDAHRRRIRETEPSRHEALFAEYEESYTALQAQLEWTARIRDTTKLELYFHLLAALFHSVVRTLKLEDPAMTSSKSEHWLHERQALGSWVVSTLENFQPELREVGASERLNSLRLLQAIAQIDYVALPALSSATADDPAIHNAVRALRAALATLAARSSLQDKQSERNYWRSKCYRHLAMASIKETALARALLFLANSGFFVRNVLDDGLRGELSSELRRGYAEATLLTGDLSLARSFIEGSEFQLESIGQYIPDDARDVSSPFPSLRVRFLLIRHAERDSDAQRRFGFSGSITERGRGEFQYLLSKTVAIVRERMLASRVIIVTSEPLDAEAQQLSRDIQSRSDVAVDVLAGSDWNPINVGRFRNLSEMEAQFQFPGEHRILMEYRYGVVDGFNLSFPGGESVRSFEERIAQALAGVFDLLSEEGTAGSLPDALASTVIVLYGHTSTVTAVFNLLSDLNRPPSTIPSYAFRAIETGTVVEADFDLLHRRFGAEIHREER